ncbi:hypothetical protein GLOIN_2v1776868 [Rhizophagus irregularis DAOM 181602=DAOM 197198]|nr:hypothetical protein GLOIN_2v1776868 [Rhizophagus irregularis DAOM 181602=DAOM 197198]
MVECSSLQNSNENTNSPFLIDCKGCARNISRRRSASVKCLIYIEKEVAVMIKSRWEKEAEGGERYIKPYMTLENIIKRNDIVIEDNLSNLKSENIDEMAIDSDIDEMVHNSRRWLDYMIEKEGIYNILNNFITVNLRNFIDKEIILQIGGVIQKGSDVSLDGFFAIEIFPKKSNIEKFCVEGRVKNIRYERKIYIIALIVAIIILPCNIIIDLQTDLGIVAWLYKYSKVGSIRRDLDDPNYIYLICVNEILELKNIKLKVVNEMEHIQVATQEFKLPALKRELIKGKTSIPEVVLKINNILIDEYVLRWNNKPIEGAYRHWFKKISNNINRIDVILLDYVKDCFINSNGANVTIDWKKSFRLINNEISTPRNITSRVDASIRTFRVKNFFKILPTYEILWNRKVWGIKSIKCPRCMIEDETWDHIWICTKNDVNNSEYVLFKESVSEVISSVMVTDKDENLVKEFERNLFDIASTRSKLMTTENLLREVTRDLKRKKREEELDEMIEESILENIENRKNKKKIKKLTKIDLEENVKNDVFSLGKSDRNRLGNRIISNLVNT